MTTSDRPIVPGRAACYPSLAELDAMLEESYGLTGGTEPLGGEATINLRLTAGDRVLAVKVGSEAAVGEAMMREATILDGLGACTLERVAVPAVVRTTSDALTAEVVTVDGERFRVMVTSFMRGDPMAPHAQVPGVARRVGAALAELDRALASQTMPRAPVAPLWGLRSAGALLDLPREVLVEAGVEEQSARIELARRDVLPRLSNRPVQWIHHDANPSNLFVETGSRSRIGVIDFGDADPSARVVEVAVAAAYLVDADAVSRDPFAPVRELVAGYHGEDPLTADEVVLVPELMALRYAMALTITCVQAVREPANRDYVLRNTRFARTRQDALDAYGGGRLAAELALACR